MRNIFCNNKFRGSSSAKLVLYARYGNIGCQQPSELVPLCIPVAIRRKTNRSGAAVTKNNQGS
ncbi:hypothetical protein MGG_17172 [Pyricularia oryzae 70-15]|uniref:Uncharacterized protein n=1 Tax=Pyricularia oryzae (strain 70-15 / ATCC MYA-4617 / FGSC 8958) TaxID=242507 RepID=G4N6M0_PYRO7|nr:uncharacterized protein MGG_17172 [Pyricularia oryzae 70-15]EHA50689.1 hypothetical protein MGG_17172 [Pyricularia oryzae 70-15]KAI7916215.1 hypothetical protein M9X92_008003 [Pyricularia oryzae]KAI7920578.1 hypothetical protein M0657_006539 [Pyricularia oryzae]